MLFLAFFRSTWPSFWLLLAFLLAPLGLHSLFSWPPSGLLDALKNMFRVDATENSIRVDRTKNNFLIDATIKNFEVDATKDGFRDDATTIFERYNRKTGRCNQKIGSMQQQMSGRRNKNHLSDRCN